MRPSLIPQPGPVSGLLARLLVATLLASGTLVASAALGSSHAPPARAAARGATTPGTQVYAWGDNRFGQLGESGTPSCDAACPSFVPPAGQSVSALAAGDDFSLALLSDGTVRAWGANGFGQLGPSGPTAPGGCPGGGTAIPCSPAPVVVSGLSHVTKIAAGATFALALRDDGTVWAWGDNADGQLGPGGPSTPGGCPAGGASSPCSPTPIAVSGLGHVKAIAAGTAFGLAALDDGTVRAWGSDGRYQLGPAGPTTPGGCPDQGLVGPCSATPVAVTGLGEVAALAAGATFALALRDDGTVWGWGDAEIGEIGYSGVSGNTYPDFYSQAPVPLALTGVAAIAAGEAQDGNNFPRGHGVALRDDGTAWAWGYNNYGEAGIEPSPPPFGWCDYCQFTPAQMTGLMGVTQVAAGGHSSYALTSLGTVWAWGDNDHGQLGNGVVDTPAAPNLSLAPNPDPAKVIAEGDGNMVGVTAIAAGAYHALAVGTVTTQFLIWALACKAAICPPGCIACVVDFSDPENFSDPAADVRTLILFNPGRGTLRVTGVTLGGPDAADFALNADSCRGATLSGTSSCHVVVRFAPGAFAFGKRSATLLVQSDGPQRQVGVQLAGTNPFSVAKLARVPLLWAAGGALAVLVVAAVAFRALRRRPARVATGERVGG